MDDTGRFFGEYASRQEAVKAGHKEARLEGGGGPVYALRTGRAVPCTASQYAPDAEDVLDTIACRTDDHVGDFSEFWSGTLFHKAQKGAREELTESVRKLVDDWATKHDLQPDFYAIVDVQDHGVWCGEEQDAKA
ncbi:MAG: hypothetical protein V3S01_10665 [Dehalococcoidia bacterium]